MPAQSDPRKSEAVETIDPFASFETSGPETAWEQEQTRKTVAFLHGHRKFDEVFRRVREYRNQPQPPKQVELRGNVTFSLEEATPSTGMSILRREGKSGATALFRVGSDEASRRTQIDFMVVSPSGRFIAVGTSDAGTEETLVRVLDGRTGKDVGDRSNDVQLEQVVWLPDDSGYLYLRGRGSKNVAVQDRIRDISVALHTLGKSAEQDLEVVGSRAPGKRIHADFEDPYPLISPNGRDVVISVRRGVDPDRIVFSKKRDSILDGKSEWARLYDESDRVKATAVGDQRLLALRSIENDRYTLEEVLLDRPSARRVLYTSKHPLEQVRVSGKDAYVVERDMATKHLVIVRGSGEISRVTLPPGTSVWTDTLRLDPLTGKLIAGLKAWTEPTSWWVVANDRKRVEPLSGTSSIHRTDAYDVRTMEAPARDGERIPLTVVRPKGERDTPPRFVWVSAYGAYGTVNGPQFTVGRRMFLEAGGAYVFAHVRGGGEKGRAWHEQARGAKKIKTVEDAIDSVKFLRSAGFGKDGGIFVSGGSAGGIPVGGLLVREPGLVDAVFIDIGVVNVSRIEAAASAAGAIHRQEFGTDDTPEAARALREIDAYLNIRNGISYPATLVRAGVNDVRVPRWQSSKFAARLQKATTATSPILLRMTGGGHGAGNTRDEAAEMEAELITFALSSIKHPEFE